MFVSACRRAIPIFILKKKCFEKKPIHVRVVDLVLESMRWKQSRVYQVSVYQAGPLSKFQNFKISITFWISTSQKGAFYQIVKKSLILHYKKCKINKKTIAIFLFIFFFLKKERQRQPAPPSPKKVPNFFCIFGFWHFWDLYENIYMFTFKKKFFGTPPARSETRFGILGKFWSRTDL